MAPLPITIPVMHKTSLRDHKNELVLIDEENPRSLVRLLPEPFAKRIKDVWSGDNGYLFGYTEHGLKGELFRKGKSPTAQDNRLRLQFWLEYDFVQSENGYHVPAMNMSKVIGTQYPKESFYKFYITDDYKLAWLICPPVNYENALKQAIDTGLQRYQDFLDNVKMLNPDGTPNVNAIRDVKAIEQIIFFRQQALSGRAPAKREKTFVAPEVVAVDPAIIEAKKVEEREARRARIAALKEETDKAGKA